MSGHAQKPATNIGYQREGEKALVEIATTAEDSQSLGSASPLLEGAGGGLGLEIVTIADLPDAENYGDHEFYYENFTASEIAYSIQQPSAKASFGGLLAAKKAIVKSAGAIAPFEDLKRVEIAHDAEGAPTHPGCLLSIAHANAIAIAVALSLSGVGPSGFSPARGAKTAGAATGPRKRRPDLYIALVLLSLLFLFGFGLWKILGFAFGRHF
ncbi:4'-phosphopantetheinyl transferase superfamily protein [Methylocapsa polymorpha]|uniref:4'-phosphopantetheinyl transferase superfamily protein n=1 Tax=Methylocapsa polymorpha TaxID=3080828 RepID=A0ABZ0HPD1_9HYPH|nr:4'-phosphopantetheinyl transferase superfamily protein [Methylocapsa sp. RX1]